MTAGPAILAEEPHAPPADAPERLCEGCGYDLRALPAGRCPECGLAFDPAVAPPARIPWLRRRKIGRLVAFWQTVAFVTFSPRLFTIEFLRASRVATADARRFRGGCVGLAVGSLAAVCVATLPGGGQFWPAAAVVAVAALTAGWIFFGLLAAASPFDPLETTLTGEHVWLNALNGYASAPLAFTPLPAAAACAAVAFLRGGGVLRDAGEILLWLAAAGVLAQAAALWVGGLAIIRQVRHHTRLDMIWPAVCLPIRWALIGLLTCVATIILAVPLSALATLLMD